MLNSETVEKIFNECLFREEEIVNGKPIVEPVAVEGIMNKFGFHPGRIKASAREIKELLNELPKEFSDGGGWTFLNMCTTKDGQLWTGLHQTCEQLMALGMAIGKVRYTMPKEFWAIMPGGVPYITVLKEDDNS